MNLGMFACEHIGLSKKYSNSELKRKLLPAVRELEERRYLEALPDDDRFRRGRPGAGAWTTVFVKAQQKVTALPSGDEETERTVSELVARGIMRRSAGKLLAHHPLEQVREKIRLYDWMKGRGGEGAIRNRAGWLYSAIVNDYRVPPAASGVRREAMEAPRAGRNDRKGAGAGVPPPEPSPFDLFWLILSPAEREAFEGAAVEAASPFLRKQYEAGKEGRGSLWQATRERILVAHFGPVVGPKREGA